MPNQTAELAVDAKNALGEGVFWCDEEQAVYWLDVPLPAPAIHRLDPVTGKHDIWPMPEGVASMSKRRDGRLLVASDSGLHVFDPADGSFFRVAAPEAHLPANRSNDGAPDALGRFWYGSMVNNLGPGGEYLDLGPSTGTLYKVEHDLKVIPVASGFGVPNCTAWSPDSKTMYFADTAVGAIFAYDFNLELGGIANQRVFADGGIGYPDGGCVDAEGYLWNARWEGGAVIRFAPDGSVDRIIDVPAKRVTCCAFGGAALDTLFITTSRSHLTEDELKDQPDAGGLFAIKLGVTGLPRPVFGL